MNPLTEAVIRVYASFPHSVDRLASSAGLRQEFKSRLPAEFQRLDDDELVGHLLRLRKARKLPRKQHPGV
jgi:hypothetical protein